MDVGFFSMNTGFCARIHVVTKAIEERGSASLWLGDHSHNPTSRATPSPTGGDVDSTRAPLDGLASTVAAVA